MSSAFVVREKDVSGHLTALYTDGDKVVVRQVEDSKTNRQVMGSSTYLNSCAS